MTTIKRAADLQLGDIVETPKRVMVLVGISAPPPGLRGYVLAMHARVGGATDTLPGIMDDDEPMTVHPGFGCPRCLRVSHHPKDIEARYCGACHLFWPKFPGGA